MPVANAVAGVTLSDQTMSQTATAERLDDVDADNPRIVTRAVADRYASNTLNRPQYRVGDTDISVVNGTPYWAAPLAPDGLFNTITKRQAGTVLVDMTTQQANIRSVDGELEIGVGTIFHRNYRWELLKSQAYLVDYGDPKMVIHNETQYIAVPYSEPQFHLTPLPHTTPQWEASLSSIQVVQSKRSRLPRLLPVRFSTISSCILSNWRSSRSQRQSIATGFSTHTRATKTDRDCTASRRQKRSAVLYPPLSRVRSTSSPSNRTATHRDSRSCGRSTAKAAPSNGTCQPTRCSAHSEQRTSCGQSAPQTDWDRFSPAEPILTVIDDRVLASTRRPRDNSGIAYVAFVDARSGDVDSFEQTDTITQFLAGETPVETPTETEPSETTAETPTVIVQRVAENGTVIETMTVYDDESVEIRTPTNGTAGTENTTARTLGS